MNYIEDILLPDERVVIDAKVSPAPYIRLVILLVLLGVSFIIGCHLKSIETTNAQIFGTMILSVSYGGLIGLLFGTALLVAKIKYTEYKVTTLRILSNYGYFCRNINEILLSKIEKITINQNFVGKLLNCGTVSITGPHGTILRIKDIVNPLLFENELNQVIEHVHSNMSAQKN